VHVSKLLRLADELVFCFDGDTAGRKAAWRALEVSLALAPDHKPIRFLFLPDGEDPDTYIRKKGKEAFESRVREAETLSQFLLAQLRADADLATAEGRAKLVSIAKTHVEKITAPALRLQITNEVAQLARMAEGDVDRLLGQPQRPRFTRAAPAKRTWDAPRSPEWSLLACLLTDLGMIEHIDPSVLTPDLPETRALLAIRDFCAAAADEPSFPLLIEGLEGNAALDLVLSAQRYADEVGFDSDGALSELRSALGKLDLVRRKKELDELVQTGLKSRDAQIAFQEKNLAYKRLQGALPSP